MSTTSTSDIASLSRRVLLGVFDERDAARRAEAIAAVFADDILFIDHNGAQHGRATIGTAVERLHARFPGFRFRPLSEPEVLDGAARLHWGFGPPDGPPKVTGTDTIVLRDGRVAVMVVFLDPH